VDEEFSSHAQSAATREQRCLRLRCRFTLIVGVTRVVLSRLIRRVSALSARALARSEPRGPAMTSRSDRLSGRRPSRFPQLRYPTSRRMPPELKFNKNFTAGRLIRRGGFSAGAEAKVARADLTWRCSDLQCIGNFQRANLIGHTARIFRGDMIPLLSRNTPTLRRIKVARRKKAPRKDNARRSSQLINRPKAPRRARRLIHTNSA